ncbi:MAG: valine--tRNA ligase [Spirochaeta sp. LUC14_002_19_P3]|nr:MAG: valine--tRNA ligase [Spirochaeta sp. LUC14_002_19_P3]
MNTNSMPTAYNPKEFEDRIYKEWKEGGCFAPRKEGKNPFVIVIPPPNVTGILHMGHGLNNTLQDFLIRYWRMKGRPALWIPGTDHAGIATQNVVERRLKERGQNRHSLGREKFLEETWKVKEEHHGIISRQLETIGASCDWSRERFTMDEGCSRAVREVFVSLHERGLLYRGEYLVNWCPSCGTALADDEVDHGEKKGGLWEIDYPLADGSGVLTVATTRPETMFGDTAVAVHPSDARYKHLIGKMLTLPIAERTIPVIADAYVDREFGTGCLKVTPAHDTNDYEIGRRHELEMINVLNSDGTMNSTAPEFIQGMPAKQARKAVVEKLESLGALKSYKEHIHQVGHCYRCSAVVEPFLSEQWFVRMKPLAEKALEAWREGKVVFYPRKWENTYSHWLENLRDWCISRQIWWGHQIPAWTCAACGKLHVLRENPECCPDCGGELTRDPDVLDTWFSSWLWPFSTLGWPNTTPDLTRFYPTTTLVTGYDIIFFWVARMIMAGLEFLGQVPFRDIYITGLIRDKLGRKMSKSLNNGIDPIEVVNTYGADALKFTLVYLSAQGEDIPLDMETCKLGSKFANKIWNAARFVLMNCEDMDNLLPEANMANSGLSLADRWIRSRFNTAVKKVETAMNSYRFDDMAHAVYEYFWNDYCDWYLEAAKLGLYGKDEAEKRRSIAMQLCMLEESLKLVHPFLPFVTEEIWSRLPARSQQLISTSYPEANPLWDDAAAETAFSGLQALVSAIRTLRSEFTIPPAQQIKVRVEITDESAKSLEDSVELTAMLVRSNDLGIAAHGESHEGAIAAVGRGFTAHIYIKDAIDIDAAIARFRKSVEKTKKTIEAKQKKLANQNFTSRAPKDVIDREKAQLAELEDSAKRSMDYLSALERR